MKYEQEDGLEKFAFDSICFCIRFRLREERSDERQHLSGSGIGSGGIIIDHKPMELNSRNCMFSTSCA